MSFVCGEPGIGKTRLLEELAVRASDEVCVLWGRCWEAGAASAYWPWIQILRDLIEQDAQLPVRLNPYLAAQVAQIVPELATMLPDVPELPRLEPAQARFELLDAVSRVLSEAAGRRPLLLLLEDLHAADASTLGLLEFVGRRLRTAPLAVVATYRAMESASGECAAMLSRLSQQGAVVSLSRFRRPEVETMLQEFVGPELAGRVASDVLRTTEGNPLFLVEFGRLLGACGSDRAAVAAVVQDDVPWGLRRAIAHRLEVLSERARDVLALGSLSGREFELPILAQAFEADAHDLEVGVAESVRASVVLQTGAGRYRYSHILVREVVHQGIPIERRRALHLRLAELWERRVEPACWEQAAYHYFEAGPAAWSGAVRASKHVARQALERHAHDEAVAACRKALEVLDHAPAEVSPEDRIGVLIDLGRAQMVRGDVGEGRGTCLQAAALARVSGLPEALSEAALAYGSVFVFARVDETLVALLREALESLPDGDGALRARVLARLAAAMQPASDPTVPIEMAHRAIDMARRAGDPHALLAALRSGCSSMMDLVAPQIRKPLNEEHVSLAEVLGDGAEMFRGALRLACDCLELGDLTAARGWIARVEAMAGSFGHPAFEWRVEAFRAASCLWSGRLEGAEAAIEQTTALGRRARDPNAAHAALCLRCRLLSWKGATDELAALLPAVARMFEDSPGADPLARVYAHGFRLEAAMDPGVLPPLRPDTVEVVLRLRDQTALFPLARVALERGDEQLARRVFERLSEEPDHLITGGVLGMTWDGPRRWPMALLAHMVGQSEQAERWLGEAADQARALGGDAVVARIEADRAALRRDDGAGAPDEIRTEDLEETFAWSLRREGEYWTVRCGERTFRIRSVKGLEMLSTLVEHPGREYHVLDLAHPERGFVDPDGGEVIDAEARASYAARIRALREDLEEAEANHDLGRAARAGEELAALEQQLVQAVGFGGRHRKARGAAERARVNVQRRLRDAIRRISANDEALGRHLLLHVRTGTFCLYE